MRKLLFVLFVLGVTVFAANAQEKAIGLRLGSDIEASFQFPVAKNRIELDAGMNFWAYGYNGTFRANVNLNLTGAYHWVFNIGNIEGFKWFVGPGLTIGSWSNFNYFTAGVLAQGGVEYNFKFPLQIAADYRPTFLLAFGNNEVGYVPYWYNFALSARYRF